MKLTPSDHVMTCLSMSCIQLWSHGLIIILSISAKARMETVGTVQSDRSHFKLKRLSSDLHNPCYLLHLNEVNVLLDCCIDTSLLSHFMPRHQLSCSGCSSWSQTFADLPGTKLESHANKVFSVDGHHFLDTKLQFCLMNSAEFDSVLWDTVDVILVSNTRSLFGLPFICEGTNFRGRILATEPVVKFGKILMEDVLEALERLPSDQNDLRLDSSVTKTLPPPLNSLVEDHCKVWKSFYTRQAITDALGRIQLITFHEPVDLFGLLTVIGSSSGYGIGSCNWILKSESEKIAYISHTTLLYSHVLPFDDTTFADCDILIVGTVSLTGNAQLEKTVVEYRHIIVQTLARGGHVLVPSNPCGLLFDLIETAIHAKENFSGNILPVFSSDVAAPRLQTGAEDPAATSAVTTPNSDHLPAGGSSVAGQVARAPVFAISSQITVSLAYANAYGEWLNPEKEALLYTADAPFPYNQLIQSGHLVPLESLHHMPALKDFSRQSRCASPSSSLLSGGTSTVELREPSNKSVGSSAIELSSKKLWSSSKLGSTDDVRTVGSGLVGGIWPNTPCLIFSSHPSLRLGPTVHLIRALAFGALRPSTRRNVSTVTSSGSVANAASNVSTLPRHSIILIESGDYVPRLNANQTTPDPSEYLKQLLLPYTMDSKMKSRTSNAQQSNADTPGRTSGTHTVSFDLSETATVFWLPLEARIGVSQLSNLLDRCSKPKLALILPYEAWLKAPKDIASSTETFHLYSITCGQQLLIDLPQQRLQTVRLSARLVSHLQPVHIANPSDTTTSSSAKRPRRRSDSKAPSETSAKDTLSADAKRSNADKNGSDVHSYVALVDGLLVTRDGKHWLNDPRESLSVSSEDGSLRPVQRQVRPTTPPLQRSTTNEESNKVDKTKLSLVTAKMNGCSRILVSRQPRIDPSDLISELTERGVTGAYLADSDTALSSLTCQPHIAAAAVAFGKDHLVGSKNDFILFPNPNTMIQLSNHGSHIFTVDESTRVTIRDALLSCLPVQTMDVGDGLAHC